MMRYALLRPADHRRERSSFAALPSASSEAQQSTRQKGATTNIPRSITTGRVGEADAPHTCAQCAHHEMRQRHIGPTTITIGRPELRCLVDGAFRSPELRRECPAFEAL